MRPPNILALVLTVSTAGLSIVPAWGDQPESEFLAKSPSVRRDGPRLVISAAKSSIVFTDNLVEGESYARSRLAGTFQITDARTDYLVEHTGWESRHFTLVNGQTGAKVELEARPHLSPDKRRYLSSSIDLEVGYAPNIVTIHRAVDFAIDASFDFNVPERPGGPLETKWISPTEVRLVVATLDAKGRAVRSKPIRIALKDGEWILPKKEEWW